VPVNVGGMWTSGTNFVIPSGQGGLYEMGMSLRYASQASSSGARLARFFVNGSEVTYTTNSAVGANSTNSTAQGVIRMMTNDSDVVTFRTQQSSGGDLALVSGSLGWLQRVG
jgi:hypothetical protein